MSGINWSTALLAIGLLAFFWFLGLVALASIRRPDPDDYFDRPENWGDQ